MYTWGYIINVSLAKLDLEQEEADEQGLLNRFKMYANEAITEICSTIKPDWKFASFTIYENADQCRKYLEAEGKTEAEIQAIINTQPFVNIAKSMPVDFISFGSDVNTVTYADKFNKYIDKECHDTDITFVGNKIKFLHAGEYSISYNARWKIYTDEDGNDIYLFTDLLEDNVELNVPDDILECLPSYIAHQCFKIDDEVKSSIFRNEYEMMLARIDNTHYTETKTIEIGGDW